MMRRTLLHADPPIYLPDGAVSTAIAGLMIPAPPMAPQKRFEKRIPAEAKEEEEEEKKGKVVAVVFFFSSFLHVLLPPPPLLDDEDVGIEGL